MWVNGLHDRTRSLANRSRQNTHQISTAKETPDHWRPPDAAKASIPARAGVSFPIVPNRQPTTLTLPRPEPPPVALSTIPFAMPSPAKGLASSPAFAVEPPRPSPCRPSQCVRPGEFSRDPPRYPYHPVNSHETKQPPERERDLLFQSRPSAHGTSVSFAQHLSECLDQRRIGSLARRLLVCRRVQVQARRRRLVLRDSRFRYSDLQRLEEHPAQRRTQWIVEARIGRVPVRARSPIAPCTERLGRRVPSHNDLPERTIPTSQHFPLHLLQPPGGPCHEIVDCILCPERLVGRDGEPERHSPPPAFRIRTSPTVPGRTPWPASTRSSQSHRPRLFALPPLRGVPAAPPSGIPRNPS